MRSIRKWFWSLMVLSMGVAVGAQADTLALWDFQDVTTASGVVTGLDASAATVSAGSIGFQNGADDGGTRIANSSGWNQDEFDASEKYLQFSVTTLAGYELDLSEVTIRLGRTATGPTAFTAQHSLDGFATAGVAAGSGTVTSTDAAALDAFTLSAPVGEFSGTITYRIWGHDASGTGNLRFNNFRVVGSVDLQAGEFPPSITSPSAASITDTSVTLSANIAATGGPDVTERGFVYSTTQGFDPVNEGTSIFEDEGPYGTGVFSLPVTGLTPETTYYFVGYAINSEGTSYTTEASFQTVPEPPADALVYFTFTGSSLDAEFVAADVTAEPFAASSGNITFPWVSAADWEAEGGAEPYAQGASGWAEDSQNDAKSFVIELNADAGLAMTITNISFLHRRSNAGPDTTGVSINGASIQTSALTANTVVPVSIPVAVAANLTNAIIELQGWGDTTGGGWYQVDNVLVQGFVDTEIEADIPPTVSTPTVSDIVGGTATLGGTIDDEGDATVVERGIFWSEIEGFDVATEGVKVGESGSFTTGAFTVPVTGLPPATTIYFVAFARNAAGYGLSAESQFITGTTAPVVEDPAASSITDTTATLSADITSTGGEDVNERGFVFSTDEGFDPTSEGTSVFEDDGGYGTGVYSLPIAGLMPDTVYYFVAYAINDTDTTFTDEVSFKTAPLPPDDVLAYYTFTGDSVDADIVAGDVIASEFAISAGSVSLTWFATAAGDWEALGGAEPYAQGSGGWDAADQASAKHFLVELTAEAGEAMTITNISYLHRRTGAGPEQIGVSIDGNSIYSDTLAETTVVEVSIPVTGYVDVTNAVIQFEGWDGGGGLYQIDNVLIQGTTDGDAPTPDPDPVDVEGFSFVGGQPTASFVAEAGLNYYLVYATDLTSITSVNPPVLSEWVVAASIVDATAGPETLSDPDPDDDARFYGILVTVDPL